MKARTLNATGQPIRRGIDFILFALILSCATTPPPPPTDGRAQVWGQLGVVPRKGVHVAPSYGNAYGDRRLRDVSLVDYSSPGFAVVFVDGGPVPTESAAVSIRLSRVGTSIEPAVAVVGAAGSLTIRNDTTIRHIFSYPAAGLIHALEPEEEMAIEITQAGEQSLFLLDVPEAATTVFAAPGAFSRVSRTGRYVLSGLDPSTRRIHAWHKRFPPASASVELGPNVNIKLDFQLGVGRNEELSHAH